MMAAVGWWRMERDEDMWIKRLTDCKIYGSVPPAVRVALSTKKMSRCWNSGNHTRNIIFKGTL